MSVMEDRDGYFSRLRAEVELQRRLAPPGARPLLVSHSYGAIVTMAFLQWVEVAEPGWVAHHLEGYVNLAGKERGGGGGSCLA